MALNRFKFVRYALIILALGIFLLYWGYVNLANTELEFSNEQMFIVEKGVTPYKLAEHVLKRSDGFTKLFVRLYFKVNSTHKLIKTGTYKFSVISFAEFFDTLAQGKEHNYLFTVIEGERFSQVLKKLSKLDSVTQSESIDFNNRFTHVEGALLADTYAYTYGQETNEILKRAHEKLVLFLEASWESRQTGLPYSSPYDALVMASIIEKETAIPSERPLIASVFVNRLNEGMRLQTDPTVIYGLGERFDGDLKKHHLREKTPYNTYRISGLPPSPIAIVGRAAIEAALHPTPSDYLYFVSKGNGEHHFSENLQQHNQAVRKYQLQ